MNGKELILKRKHTRDRYKVPGSADYQKPPFNAVYFRGGGIRHEMAKALGGFQVKRWGEPFMDEKIRFALEMLEIAVDSYRKKNKLKKNPKWFITEGQERTKSFNHQTGTNTPTRDLIILDDGRRFEWETDEKRSERHTEDDVEVIML